MFKALMICAIFGLAVAAVHQPGPHHPAPHVERHDGGGRADDVHAEVLSRKDDVRPDGFDSSLETSNHISENRNGDEHGNINGNFAWISPEGEHIEIKYTADEHGYQPSGAAIPAVPEHVVRSLAWNAAHAHEDNHGHNVHH